MTRFPQIRAAFWLSLMLFFSAVAARGQVYISEFMALNQFTTLADEDGEKVDWLELYNAGTEAVNLNGWYLSDNAGDLRKWQFPVTSPVVNLTPGGRLLIYASGKNRKLRADRLHTNFKLESSGGFLALTKADGVTIAHQYAAYPQQLQDVAYGIPTAPWTTVVAQGAQGKAKVPTSAADLTTGWNSTAGFDDAAWQAGQTGFGYDTTGSYGTLLGTGGDLQAAMYTVNPSALVRVVFNVADPATVTALRLQMKYDDGYICYLNGTKISESNAPGTPSFDSSATIDRDGALVQNFEVLSLPTAHQALVAGDNVLAFQLLNFTNGSTPDTDAQGTANGSRALLLPVLEATYVQQPTYLLTATPRAANSAARTNVGPLISKTTDTIPRPLGNASSPVALITTKVVPSLRPIGAVQLKYRVMFNAEQTLSMVDDGTSGDAVAGDGMYSALMPTSGVGAGQMLRWRVVATDSLGSSSTEPRYLNPLDNDQYFGTVALEVQTANSTVPVMHWFVQNPSASQTEGGTRCSLFFLGRFYDNVFVGLHGQSSSGFAVQKKSHDFNFSKDNRFTWKDGEKTQRAINMITTWADKSHVRDTLAWESWQRAGHVASHWAQIVRVQQNGTFWGLYDMVENGDEDFLDRALDPEGALYKIYNSLQDTSGAEKKSREFEGSTDLQSLIDGLNPAAAISTRRLFAYDNVDIASLVNYLANNVLIINNDFGHKNYYVYRDTNGTGEWSVLPWDQDLSLGHTWTGSQGYFNDDIDSQRGLVIGAASGNRLMNLIMNTTTSTVAPEMAKMFLRRLRTLMDTQLLPPNSSNSPMEQRIYELLDSIDPPNATFTTDADSDLQKWGYWLDGGGSSIAAAGADAATHDQGPRKQAQRIINSNPNPPNPSSVNNAEGLGDTTPAFMTGRRNRLYNLNQTLIGLPIPPSQPAVPTGLTVEQIEANPASGNGEEEYFVIKNTSTDAVDISGWTISGAIDHTFIGGTVIPPGGGTTENVGLLHMARNSKAFRARTSGPKGGQFRYVVRYDGRLSARGGTIELRNSAGTIVTSTTYPAAPTPAQTSLRVTEVNYAPKAPTPAEIAALPGIQASDFEFIELTNTGTAPLNIGGAQFDRGITFTFPADFTLAPGARTVVVASQLAFNLRYGTAANIAGQCEGNLDNSGELLRILDKVGEEILRFTYDPGWYPGTAGVGQTLVSASANPAYDGYNVAEGWVASTALGGSPGTAEPATVSAPEAGTITNSTVTVTFNLATVPLAGSLKIAFNDGVTTRLLTLAASEEVVGAHTVTFNPANPTATPAIASGETIPDGIYSVTVLFRDVADNPPAISAAGPSVTIDRAGPAITPPANVVVEATSSNGAIAAYEEATASDLSEVASLVYSKASGSLFPIGVTEVTVTATDNAANVSTMVFTVKVQDTTAPQITASPAARILDGGSGGSAAIPDLTGEVVGNDAVGISTVTQSPLPGTMLGVGPHVISFTVKDAAGNSAATTSNVEVIVGSASGTSVLGSTGTPAPGAGSPNGPPAGSTLAAFGTPAISDLRHVAAKAMLKLGRKSLGGIYVEDPSGAAQMLTFQGASSPGVGGGIFKSFLDPVISPSGSVAFVAKISGAAANSDEGIWTNAFTGQLDLALREGQPLPGVAGPLLNKISSISLRDGELLALVTFKPGTGGVTVANDTALVRVNAEGSSILLREGTPVATTRGTAGIKAITVLSPAPGSPGYGRWHADGEVVAKVSLADKRDVVVTVKADGSMTPHLESGDAISEAAGAPVWSTFGRPAIDVSAGYAAVVGTLQTGVGGVSAQDNSAIAVGTDADGFSVIAREGSSASDGGGSLFASFADPLVNDAGKVLFGGTLKGAGVTAKNKTALWWGTPTELHLLARVGSVPTDKEGVPASALQWLSFVSSALPSGDGAGPIFLAKIKGVGVTPKSNLGVWAVDANGVLRLSIRTGDQLTVRGVQKVVTGLALLDAPRTAFGTGRSYNATRSIAVRATFSDKSQAIVRIDLP